MQKLSTFLKMHPNLPTNPNSLETDLSQRYSDYAPLRHLILCLALSAGKIALLSITAFARAT